MGTRARWNEANRSASLREFDPEPWRGELLTFARRMGGGAEAEDIVHEAFVRALTHPPSTHPRAYLHRIVLHVLRDRSRSSSVRAHHAQRVAIERSTHAPEADPFRLAEAGELARLAWCAAEKLPDQQRAALLLRVQRHMDYDELATALDCSIAAARSHFHHAVKAVRKALERLDRERHA
jgi:RNA polymerase sigma-70 factor (ECF subfamily)